VFEGLVVAVVGGELEEEETWVDSPAVRFVNVLEDDMVRRSV
jgi:hypothetical protein